MKRPFQNGQCVRYTQQALELMQDAERRRMMNRVGVVSGYRLGATRPIVLFPSKGRFPEIRRFDVNPKYLVVIQDRYEANSEA